MRFDDSHEILYLIFFRKLGKKSQNLSWCTRDWRFKGLSALRREHVFGMALNQPSQLCSI